MSTQYNRLLADYFNLAEASYADFSKAQIGTKYNEYLAKDAMLNDKEKSGAEHRNPWRIWFLTTMR